MGWSGGRRLRSRLPEGDQSSEAPPQGGHPALLDTLQAFSIHGTSVGCLDRSGLPAASGEGDGQLAAVVWVGRAFQAAAGRKAVHPLSGSGRHAANDVKAVLPDAVAAGLRLAPGHRLGREPPPGEAGPEGDVPAGGGTAGRGAPRARNLRVHDAGLHPREIATALHQGRLRPLRPPRTAVVPAWRRRRPGPGGCRGSRVPPGRPGP